MVVPQGVVQVTGAQACVLQLWLDTPVQEAPPFAGEGLVQVLDWVPPPQLTEQADQDDQPPFTGRGFATQLLPFHTCGEVQVLQEGGLFAPLLQEFNEKLAEIEWFVVTLLKV